MFTGLVFPNCFTSKPIINSFYAHFIGLIIQFIPREDSFMIFTKFTFKFRNPFECNHQNPDLEILEKETTEFYKTDLIFLC